MPAQEKTTQPATEQPVHTPQPVQYVMMEKSLKGVGGWLIFWIVIFALVAIGYIWAFFASMLSLSSAVSILALIFAPILAAGCIASVVLISLQKRLGRLITLVTLGVSALYMTINSIVSYIVVNDYVRSSYDSYGSYTSPSKSIPILIAGILVSLLIHGLVALYFILSRRVKETLVK